MPLTSLTQRRLDSLAWLIRGNEDCAAVSFDGKRLLFANNLQKESDIFHRIQEYLSEVAKTSFELNEKSKKLAEDLKAEKIEHWQLSKIIFKEYQEQKQRCKRRMEDILNYAKLNIEFFIKKEPFYIDAFTDSLKKITRSIRHTYLYQDSTEKLDLEVANAMLFGNLKFVKVSYVSPSNYIVRMHAEMQVLQHLYTLEKINSDYYIGVSKKCCKNCEKIIEAFNHVKKVNVEEGKEVITVRGSSSKYFHSQWPPFLETNLEIQKEFLRLIGAEGKSLKEVFYGKEGEIVEHATSKDMDHDRSDSQDKSTEGSNRFSTLFAKSAKKSNEDDFSEDGEQEILKQNFDEANKSYNRGKVAFFSKQNENALKFFLEAKEKYKSILKADEIPSEIKAKSEKRLTKLKNPEGKYSTSKLKL